MTPEFSRPFDADPVSDQARRVAIEADETERRRLAGRFRLERIEALSADIALQRRAGVLHAEGRVAASVVQNCVVTGDPMPATIDAPFAVRFADEGAATADEEFELSADACDTLPIENGRIDLGELAAETLALALDPYPRCARADEALHEMGKAGDPDAGPFAVLKGLRDQL